MCSRRGSRRAPRAQCVLRQRPFFASAGGGGRAGDRHRRKPARDPGCGSECPPEPASRRGAIRFIAARVEAGWQEAVGSLGCGGDSILRGGAARSGSVGGLPPILLHNAPYTFRAIRTCLRQNCRSFWLRDTARSESKPSTCFRTPGTSRRLSGLSGPEDLGQRIAGRKLVPFGVFPPSLPSVVITLH